MWIKGKKISPQPAQLFCHSRSVHLHSLFSTLSTFCKHFHDQKSHSRFSKLLLKLRLLWKQRGSLVSCITNHSILLFWSFFAPSIGIWYTVAISQQPHFQWKFHSQIHCWCDPLKRRIATALSEVGAAEEEEMGSWRHRLWELAAGEKGGRVGSPWGCGSGKYNLVSTNNKVLNVKRVNLKSCIYRIL